MPSRTIAASGLASCITCFAQERSNSSGPAPGPSGFAQDAGTEPNQPRLAGCVSNEQCELYVPTRTATPEITARRPRIGRVLVQRRASTGRMGAYTFFAALYFVQSVGDPSSGLIAQPVRSLLKNWGECRRPNGGSGYYLGRSSQLLVYYRTLCRCLDLRNYLLMANGVAALSLLLLALAPLSPENRWLLIGLLLPTTTANCLGRRYCCREALRLRHVLSRGF